MFLGPSRSVAIGDVRVPGAPRTNRAGRPCPPANAASLRSRWRGPTYRNARRAVSCLQVRAAPAGPRRRRPSPHRSRSAQGGGAAVPVLVETSLIAACFAAYVVARLVRLQTTTPGTAAPGTEPVETGHPPLWRLPRKRVV